MPCQLHLVNPGHRVKRAFIGMFTFFFPPGGRLLISRHYPALPTTAALKRMCLVHTACQVCRMCMSNACCVLQLTSADELAAREEADLARAIAEVASAC